MLKKKNNPVIPESDTTIGNLTGSYTTGNFTYSSSIDAISNLYAKYSYDAGLSNLPVLIIMHGFGGNTANISSTTMNRYASYKNFVVTVGMRGRDGASGSNDAGGREIYDIYDAIQYVITTFPVQTNENKINIVGYSGGGGNVYSCLCRFPDLFNVGVSFFGISDYGYTLDGWYYQPADISSMVGGTPAAVPNNYRARHSVEAINNFKNYLYMFHSPLDADVNVKHSQRIDTAYTGINKFYYEDQIYSHGYPENDADLVAAESIFKNRLLITNNTAITNIGTYRVIGWIKTKQFEVRLGTLNNHVVDLSYNITNKTFIVTPLTGSQSVSITYNSVTQTQTINSQTTFQF